MKRVLAVAGGGGGNNHPYSRFGQGGQGGQGGRAAALIVGEVLNGLSSIAGGGAAGGAVASDYSLPGADGQHGLVRITVF